MILSSHKSNFDAVQKLIPFNKLPLNKKTSDLVKLSNYCLINALDRTQLEPLNFLLSPVLIQ